MAFSDQARKWMKVWVVLAGLMFFAQCALQARPYLGVILGTKHDGGDAPGPVHR
ncbi:MAG: hypothetical protein ABW252_02585 [Polyangiales bacterium]